MGLKQCEKCTEMVDEAKAFCPACGNAFVEEKKRQKASEFESAESTVQLGKTDFDKMLSDMGLDISKQPSVPEKRVEIITPIAPAAKQTEKPTVKPAPVDHTKRYIMGGVVIIVVYFIVIMAAVIGYIYWFRR